jgi:gliding motility-associated-like protein
MRNLLLLFLIPILSFGQNEFNQWHFGYNVKLDFNSGAPVVSYQSSLYSIEGSTSVADCDGDLLFYTDGQIVYNKNHSVMSNGTNLKGESALYSSTQSALIVKRPRSAAIYYIFTASDIHGISYSIVNMQANNGLGSIIQKNTSLSFKPSQKLAVTYHQNGEDIWVATHYENSDQYEVFKVTQTGVSSNSVSSYTGPKHTGGHGDMKFNQQGTKIGAVVQDQSMVSIADFNNSSGQFFNSFGIVDKYGFPHGVDFSPSGSYMYVSSFGGKGGVYQLSTGQGNVNALKNGFSLSGNFAPSGSLQLGPDGKIYVAHDGGQYLSVIHNPNNYGSLAGFDKDGLLLGFGKSSWELSNATLVNNTVPAPNGIIASDFCFSFPTDFGVLSEIGVVSVLWDFSDPTSGASNNSTVYYPNHIFSSAGVYSVTLTVTTVCGVDIYTFPLTIENGPNHSFQNQEICRSTDFQIVATSFSGESYSWSPSIGLNNSNIVNPIFNSFGITDTSLTYYLTSSTLNGCSSLDSFGIDLLDLPLAGIDQFQCPGFSVGLDLDGSEVSVTWSPNQDIDNVNSFSPVVQAQNSMYYYAAIVDSNGCANTDSIWIEVGDDFPVEAGNNQKLCFGDTINIGGIDSLSNASYFWGVGFNILNEKAAYTKAYPTTDQIYKLTVSIDTCSKSDSVFVKVNSLPEVEIQPQDTSVCFQDTVVFNAINSTSFKWYIADNLIDSTSSLELVSDTSFILMVEGVDTNSCINKDTTSFTVLQLPDPVLTKDSALCIGDSLVVEVTGGQSYEWINHELTGTADSVFTLIPQVTKTYNVVLTGSNSCLKEDSIKVTVNTLPVIRIMSDTLICEGTSAKLWASGGTKYNWSPSTNLSNTNFNSVQVSPTTPIAYQVVVEDTNGCVDSANTSISLNTVPESNYSYTFIPSCLGFEVEFKDSSVNADSYQWVFGDGSTSIDLDPFHVYDFNTQPKTSLIVGNNGVCFDTLTTSFKWQKISDFIDVFAPNIITPNGDGINECFEVKVPAEFEGCIEYKMYNRWGLKVYDTKEFHSGFCGYNAYNNKELAEGTYFYTLTINDYQINGFVTITK